MKGYLEEYFLKSQKALDGKIDENLCLLCIQCFEVAISYMYVHVSISVSVLLTMYNYNKLCT